MGEYVDMGSEALVERLEAERDALKARVAELEAEVRRLDDECRCACHRPGVAILHCVPCCHCGRRIEVSKVAAHEARCQGRPSDLDLFRELFADRRYDGGSGPIEHDEEFGLGRHRLVIATRKDRPVVAEFEDGTIVGLEPAPVSDLDAIRAIFKRAGVKIVRDEDYGSQRWRLVAQSEDGEWYRFEFRATSGRMIGLG